MKVLTLNTHSWFEEKQLEKIKQTAQIIIEKDYDAIALQEVNQKRNQTPSYHSKFIDIANGNEIPLKEDNYALLLIKELEVMGYHYYWTWTACHTDGYTRSYDEGLAILSKEPFSAFDGVVSKVNDYENYHRRKVLGINIPSWQTTICSVHFSWWESKDTHHKWEIPITQRYPFKTEWNNTIKLLSHSPFKRKIIMGDFNNPADHTGEGYDYIFKTYPKLKDVFSLANIKDGQFSIDSNIDGWSENTKGKRIDLILASELDEVTSYSVLFDGRFTPLVSDHYGIESEFTFTSVNI